MTDENFICTDRDGDKFLLADCNVCIIDDKGKICVIGQTKAVTNVFLCKSCDDTHLQIQIDKNLISLQLPTEAAEVLAKWLNNPLPLRAAQTMRHI